VSTESGGPDAFGSMTPADAPELLPCPFCGCLANDGHTIVTVTRESLARLAAAPTKGDG
jgi:hypothetical protein